MPYMYVFTPLVTLSIVTDCMAMNHKKLKAKKDLTLAAYTSKLW